MYKHCGGEHLKNTLSYILRWSCQRRNVGKYLKIELNVFIVAWEQWNFLVAEEYLHTQFH